MSDQKKDSLLLEHNYDGIQELDNSLPLWWLATFFGTIIFGFIYFVHYESGSGPTSTQELKESMAVLQALKAQGPSYGDSELAALFTDERTKEGHEIFTGRCAACHGPSGEGVIGPNLTDNFWVHGKGSRADIFQVISEGVPALGMPTWKDQLKDTELVAVSSYVYTLKGKNLQGKPPQGVEYK